MIYVWKLYPLMNKDNEPEPNLTGSSARDVYNSDLMGPEEMSK